MEPEVREFLKRVSFSLGIGLLWMALNSTFGIMYGFAFVEGHITAGNIVFYIWFIISLACMLWLFVKLWKKPLENSNLNDPPQ